LSSNQIRSFISIDLDDPQLQSRVESLTSSLLNLGADLKPVEKENVHITIKFLGSVERAKLEQVKMVLAHVRFQQFPIEVRGAGAFPNMNKINVVWIGLGQGWANVEQIYEQTEQLLSELGFARESRGFSPHVTIARVRSSRRRDEVSKFLRGLSDENFGVFQVKTLRLKQSMLRPSGPTYSTLFETSGLQ
jgi:RNA 2',3'-cyclic 3'-phosphodiesterase